MEYLSTCIADRMCTTNVISESDKEFYAYSVQLLLEKTIGIILICLFAAVFRKLFEVVAFLVVFSLIRIHSDGIHCKTSIGCFVSSVLISLSTIQISALLMNSPGICQGGADIINDFYILRGHNSKSQLGSNGTGVGPP